MVTFLGIVHIIIAVFLIFLVLVQDSKGGMGALGGGGGSNTVLGATGAENILAKITRWTAILFAISCVMLTIYTSSGGGSVIDDYVPTQPAQSAPAEAPAADVGPEAATKTEKSDSDSK